MELIVLFTLSLLAGCYATETSRIVGGEPAQIEEFPSMVQIERQFVQGGLWSQSCAGNILNSFYILSAAQCFDEPYVESKRRIRAGATNRGFGGTVVLVSRVHNHPDYDYFDTHFDSDITILRLETQLVYSPSIQQALIVNHGFTIGDNRPVVLAGWGITAHVGPLSPNLKQTTVYSVNHHECARRYASSSWPLTVSENMICAGILDVGGRDACSGDAGGPMYYQGVVVGIISWGRACADPVYPGVSTAVSPFTNWILETAV